MASEHHGRPPISTPPALTCDERHICALAHQYLDAHSYAAGLPQPDVDQPAYRSCPSYRAGQCAGWPGERCCARSQPPAPAGPGLASGGGCATGHYGRRVANQRAWPATKPAADPVARFFRITADARGAAAADRLIATTAAELRRALALTGCAESEIPALLAARAAAAALLAAVGALFKIGSPDHAENLYPTD